MKPILVTGGARGLGAAITRALAARGHDLVIHYRTSEREAQEVAGICRQQGVEAKTIQGDFANPESLRHFVQTYTAAYPQTKGLVNNVGEYLIAPALLTKEEEWYTLFHANFFAPLLLSQALVDSLHTQKGSIVHIGVAGLKGSRVLPQAPAYAITKAALYSYMLASAKELAPLGIRVNMISPGYLENAVDLPPDLQVLPMRRAGRLSEVAEIVADLFEPTYGYVTGQNIEVAGGICL